MEVNAKRPEFNGLLQTAEKSHKARRRVGRIALWYSTNLKDGAPVLQGTVKTKKGTYRVVLWSNGQKEEGDL